MKKLMLAVLAAGAFSAQASLRHNARCTSMDGKALLVALDFDTEMKKYIITVTRETDGEPSVFEQFGKQMKPSGRMGAPTVYKFKSFLLGINYTTAPGAGYRPGWLTYRGNVGDSELPEVTEKLKCQLIR